MGYRIRFATCHGQYRSVHCHRVDRQALNYDKIKMSLYGNTATFFGASGDTAFFKKHSNINGFRTPEQRNYLYSALLKPSISAAIARFISR